MKIDITSLAMLRQRVEEYDYDSLISINSPMTGPVVELPYFFFKPTLTLLFDDISHPMANMEMPQNHHITEIIDFAKTQKYSRNASSMIIHCAAGISRSSATAIIVAATLLDDVEPYIRDMFSTENLYHPNYRMISLYEKISGRKDIAPLLRKYGDWYG